MIEHFKELSTKINGIPIKCQREYFENDGALPPSLLITSPVMVVAIFAPDANKTWNEQHAASFKKAVRMINYVIQYHDTHQNLVVIYVAPDKEHYKNAERDFVNPSFTEGEYVLYLFREEDIKKVDKILSLFENIQWRIEKITFEEWLEAVLKIQDNKLVKEWLQDFLEELLKKEIALDLRQVIIDSIRQKAEEIVRQIEGGSRNGRNDQDKRDYTEGFKCFFKKQSINCDADVIILTGNNGFGKTSFIEALELMATGKIEPRIGENSTKRPFENYINKNLLSGEAKARIEVKCQDGRVFQATLLPERLDEESTLFPLNGFSTSFVRSSCFFYQDGIESTFGRSQEGIQGIADAFVGDFPNREILLDALVKAAAEVENIRSSFRANLGNEDILKNEAAEQAGNLQAIIESNEYLKQLIPFPAKLVITGRKFAARYKENLQKWVAALTGHEQGDQPVCKLLEEAIKAIESIRKQALADIPPQADINEGVARLKELLDNLPDFFPVTETSPKEDIALKELTEKEKALELELARIKTQMGLLLSEEQLPIPGTNISTWMGEIPLIASIDYMLKVKASSPEVVVDEIWSMLEKHGCDWSDKLKSKWLQYKQLHDEATAITQKIFEIRKEITGIKKKEADFDNLLQALKLWSAIFGAPLEKVNLEDGTGYDLKKARMMLKEKFVNINAAETMTAWNKVLEYLHKWQQIGQKLETIKLNWTPAAREADKKLSDFISWATKRNLDKWIEAIKGNALRENYISQLNQALEYILFQFGMGKDLAKNVHFKRSNGKLYIQRWSEDNIIRETNIFPTFSTAQINQLAIAYMLALNCGVKNHPLGFICLDDVSSAFDLNNLAADAHLIRMLAYGNNQRRQVFITSHHDIITSRLLPLLLPPSGFRLKVIEFTSFRPETGPELRFYECKQARSGYIALQNVFKVKA